MVIHSQRLKREQANGMTEIEKEKKKKTFYKLDRDLPFS